MNTLAHTWNDGGPGPWILLFPLIWALVIAGAVLLLRRTLWRGRGPWQHRACRGGDTALAALGRRYAEGGIDEDEYRRRYSVLSEEYRGGPKDGAV
ncbi:SHOCT domain-containing protein [Streptomyces polyrhachis]|uniref:SHOCT domain-containing protein n=1 Tax=Streptomyces polyrhachis TaxID=1282885 RepID=A0ABW2GAC4_9ACTN